MKTKNPKILLYENDNTKGVANQSDIIKFIAHYIEQTDDGIINILESLGIKAKYIDPINDSSVIQMELTEETKEEMPKGFGLKDAFCL